jgi:hypothetical protein
MSADKPGYYTGTVFIETFAAGSKSEHDAVKIRIGGEAYVLRLKGENPFSSGRLRSFVGKEVKVKGFFSGYTFFAESISGEK